MDALVSCSVRQPTTSPRAFWRPQRPKHRSVDRQRFISPTGYRDPYHRKPVPIPFAELRGKYAGKPRAALWTATSTQRSTNEANSGPRGGKLQPLCSRGRPAPLESTLALPEVLPEKLASNRLTESTLTPSEDPFTKSELQQLDEEVVTELSFVTASSVRNYNQRLEALIHQAQQVTCYAETI